MIQVSINERSDGSTAGLLIEGHAGLASAGNDILCAAVSVLSENLGASLTLLLEVPAEIHANDGLYRVTVPLKHHSDASELLFQSTILGLRVLAEQYPERMRLSRTRAAQ